jgi:hypothetical protein
MLMEIFLLLAVVAVGASGLFVAATFNIRARQTTEPLIDKAAKQTSDQIDNVLTKKLQDLRTELARELAEREVGSVQAQSDQMAGLISEVKRQGTQTQTQVAQIQAQGAQTQAQVDQIVDIVRRLTTMEPGRAETPLGEITVTEVTDPHHPLAMAVLEAESSCEREGWGNPPQLFALARKAKLIDDDPALEAWIREAPEDSLIPVKQKRLDEGEPRAVLAGVYWPDDVSGCVLVTELIVLPQEARDNVPSGPAAVEQWAKDQPGARPARLAVGVTRDGRHTCILRLKGEDTVRIDPGLADDLVIALLETL